MIYSSLFITILYKIYHGFYKYLHESFLFKLFNNLALKINKLLNGSFIVTFVKKDGFLSSNFQYSIIYKFIEFIINIPIIILRKIYFSTRKYIDNSIFFKLIKVLVSNLALILGFTFFIILIIPHSYSYNSYIGALILLIFVLLLIKKSTCKNSKLSINNYSLYFVIFALSIFMASVFSVFPSLSIRDLLIYLICFLIVLLVTNTIKSKDDFSSLIEMILIGVSLIGVYGIYQKIIGIPVNPSQIDLTLNAKVGSRVYSNMANPNNLAQIFVLFIPFYVSVITTSKNMIKKIIFSIFLMPPIISLLLTASRSGWIGLFIALVIYIFIKNKKILPFFILLGLISIPFLPESIYIRITTIFNLSDSSTTYRFLIMESIIPALKDYWIMGTGLGSNTFMKVIGNYKLLTTVVPPHSHNLLLQLWMELGIIGMLSFIGFMLYLFKKGLKNIKSSKNEYINDMSIASISSIIGMLVISSAEYIWYYPRVMMFFFLVVGLLIASINIQNSKIIHTQIY